MKGILEQRREAMKQKLMGEESNAISDPAVEMVPFFLINIPLRKH